MDIQTREELIGKRARVQGKNRTWLEGSIMAYNEDYDCVVIRLDNGEQIAGIGFKLLSIDEQ